MPAMPWKIKLCIGKNNYFPDWYLAMGELAAREFNSQSVTAATQWWRQWP